MASTESQEFFEHFEDSEDDYEPVATEDEIKEYENCVGKEKTNMVNVYLQIRIYLICM